MCPSVAAGPGPVAPRAGANPKEAGITQREETPAGAGGGALTAPALEGLAEAVSEVVSLSERVEAARGGRYANAEGGDVVANGSARSLARHVANYLAAAELAEQRQARSPVVDVGGGTGTLGAWLAGRLAADLQLVDTDPLLRRLAGAAFPEATVHADLGALAPASAGVVTAMEVVEHLEPGAQLAFLRGLFRLVAPGGVVVVSTPDESRYLGGHSGYAPHVGVVDAPGLKALLADATEADVHVWRLGGAAFRLTSLERYLLPVGNRAWGRLTGSAPGVVRAAARVGGAVAQRTGARSRAQDERAADARVVDASDVEGTGLLAAVCVPADAPSGS